jgi:hypothetical protein
MKREPTPTEFWAQVNTDGPRVERLGVLLTPCWLWLGAVLQTGYGAHEGQWHLRVHRIAYRRAVGPIPSGEFVMHACDVKLCVNPEHLSVGTQKANEADKIAKGRHAAGDGHGTRLHPETVARGERNGLAKLDTSKVIAIRTIYAQGHVTRAEIARRYGVWQSSVDMIVRRKAWRHVLEPAPVMAQDGIQVAEPLGLVAARLEYVEEAGRG